MVGDVSNSLEISTDNRFGEQIYTKIRWFVVVKESGGSCMCLPIQTYGRRGVSKPGISARHHAPLVAKGQMAQLLQGEKGLLPALHVILENNITIDPSSRINFSKIYTVEQNVKVCNVGRIAPEDIPMLRRHWIEVLVGRVEGEGNCWYLSHYACRTHQSNRFRINETCNFQSRRPR